MEKSSYIRNGHKLDYWIDITTTNSTSNGHKIISYNTVYGTSYNNSTSIKPEEITFIAPKSSITKEQFMLLTEDKVDISNGAHPEELDNKMKAIKTICETYSENNSPLVFRNFLTISTSDKFDKEYYIDNGFYVYKISQMGKKDFWGDAWAKTEYWRNRNNRTPPFQSPQNFYIEKKIVNYES